MNRWMIWAVGIVFLGMAGGSASTSREVSVARLTELADAVVWGRVSEVVCERDAAGRIVTRIPVTIREVWKGEIKEPVMTLVQGGGVLGARRSWVEGQAAYRPGEEVIVFVIFNKDRQGVTVDGAAGKFHVRKDPENHEWQVECRRSGAPSMLGQWVPMTALRTWVQQACR